MLRPRRRFATLASTHRDGCRSRTHGRTPSLIPTSGRADGARKNSVTKKPAFSTSSANFVKCVFFAIGFLGFLRFSLEFGEVYGRTVLVTFSLALPLLIGIGGTPARAQSVAACFQQARRNRVVWKFKHLLRVYSEKLSRLLGFAPVWFVAATATAATARFALLMLVVPTAWATWRGELDLSGKLDAIEWCLLAFALVWIASAGLGIDPTLSFRLSIPMLAALTSLFVLRRQREPAAALATFDVVLFLLGFWQCLQVLRALLDGYAGEAAVRHSAATWLVEPNDIAWVAVTWPPLLALCGDWRGRRVLAALPIALALVLMTALESRLALIASLIALAPMLARAPLRMLGTGTALAAAFAALAWFVDPAIFAKGLASITSRLQLWHVAGQVFSDWPWLGTGPYGFDLAYQSYQRATLALDPRGTPWPHSLPLEIAAACGVAGILATVGLIFAAFLHGRFATALDAQSRRVVLVQCAVFAVLGLFEASFLRLWVWMLATSILCRLPRHASEARGVRDQEENVN